MALYFEVTESIVSQWFLYQVEKAPTKRLRHTNPVDNSTIVRHLQVLFVAAPFTYFSAFHFQNFPYLLFE